MGPKPVPFSILENSVAKRDLNSMVRDLSKGFGYMTPTDVVCCDFVVSKVDLESSLRL